MVETFALIKRNIKSPLIHRLAMPDVKRYPRNIKLINSVKDNIVFMTRKVFYYDNVSIASYKQEIRESLSQRNRKYKLTIKEIKTCIS